MSDLAWVDGGDAGGLDEGAAPPPLRLSEPLPSSVTRLGLSAAVPPRSSGAAGADVPLPAAAAAGAARAGSTASFRVLAVHVDDVAEDVVLACEGNTTLLIPLEPAPAMEVAGLDGVRRQQQPPQTLPPSTSPSSTAPNLTAPTVPTAAPAACLRLSGAVQVWTHPAALPGSERGPYGAATAPAPPSALSASLAFRGCGTASTSGLCLPRRLPSTARALRRAPSVLVAVPVPPLSAAASTSAAAALQRARSPLASAQGSFAAPATSSSVSASSTSPSVPPPVMAVYIMACPVLPEGVDGIEPSAAPLARPLAKYVCAPSTLRFRDAWYPVLHLSWCTGTGAASGFTSGLPDSQLTSAPSWSAAATNDGDVDVDGGGTASAAQVRYVDHHLLCASSICVDLIQVRCTVNAAVAAAMPSVTVSVLQRYVTRTDWCTYDPCSRVLLCLNHARPAVLKPLEVYTRVWSESEEHDARRHGSQVALRTWAELSMPESPCAALRLDPGAATGSSSSELSLRCMQAPSTSSLLSSVVGALTVYGQPYVYHITQRARCDRVGAGVEGTMEHVLRLYVHLPGKRATGTPTRATALPPSLAAEPCGGARGTEDAATGGTSISSSGGGGEDSLLKRLTTAASAASGSAPPPDACDGDTYLAVAQLSLSALAAETTADSADVATSPLSASFASAAAATAASPSSSRQPPHPHPSRERRGLLPIAVQVIDNLLVVHCPATGRSAVYDLADRTSSSGGVDGSSGGRHRGGSTGPRGTPAALTSRAYVLWAAASDASRAWARAHRPRPSAASTPAATGTGAAPSPAPRSTPASHRDSNMSFASASAPRANSRVQAVQDADADASDATEPVTTTSTTSSSSTTSTSPSTTSSSPPLRPPRAPPLPVLPRTPTTLTSPLLPRAGRLNPSPSTSPSRHAVAAPNLASMLSVLTASVMELAAGDRTVTPAAVTASGAVTRGPPAAVAPASSAPWVDALYCGSMLEDVDAAAAASSYAPYRWLTSSRLPLAIAVATGELHWCRVGAARVAGWRVLLGIRDVADGVHEPRERHGGAADADTEDAGAALVRSYVAFLCRRHHPFAVPAQDASRDGTRSAVHLRSDASSDSVRALMRVLRELAALMVGTESCEGEERGILLQRHEGGAPEDADGMSEEECDVVRHLLLCAATASDTDAAEDGSDAAASARLYDVWRTVLECLTVETAVLASCETAAAAARNEAGAQLQRLVIESVLLPLWAAIQTPASSLSTPEAAARRATRVRRRRLEGLVCDYVRLLHSLAAPVDPQLQHLLLEVVLGEAVFAAVAADASTGPEPPPWTTASSGAVAAAARRVQRLLRQGTLESNDATARWLLDWWGTYHIAATAATHRRAAAAAAAAASGALRGEAHARHGHRATAATPVERLAAVPSRDAVTEAEVVFTEAVRLLEAHGSLLEVAEAHSWRSDFTAAATVLQRVPRTSGNTTHTVPAVDTWPAASHRRGTRVLTWDELALAALDGAWRGVRWAEEALYVHAASGERRLHPVQHQQRTLSGLDLAAPQTWAAQLLERQVQVARCAYMAVATTLLVRPVPAAADPSGRDRAPDVSATFSSAGAGGVAGTAAPADSAALYHAHETRYEQLRRQMEVAGQQRKVRGAR